MNRGKELEECTTWTTLMMLTVVIVVANASVLVRKDCLSSVSEVVEQVEKTDLMQEAQITYNGAQVWRVYKPEENNSYISELVQRYDEDGCM